MSRANPDACAAWHLLVEFLLSQRTHLPNLAAALRAVADAVPRPAPHRAGPADSDEAAGRDRWRATPRTSPGSWIGWSRAAWSAGCRDGRIGG